MYNIGGGRMLYCIGREGDMGGEGERGKGGRERVSE